MATLSPGLRKALLAGGIAVAVTGAGGAAVWAGTQPNPTPSDTSSSTPAPSPSASAKAGHQQVRGQGIHGEHVLKQPDGSFRTVVTQAGTIESVSGSDITVKSEDGFTQRYTINGDTKISKVPADAAQLRNGKGKPTLPSATAAELKTGDTVHISGTRAGDAVTADRIVSGELPAGVKGHGMKRGHGSA
ncbi:DUF5666 domain-containing protein [Paenarthrobacter sp. AB444]|uniref:DUF5666 domain-containing protein n=1 Tax=Paenarthrobacter sp. AB444 TaxID=3025681 RepID=UPI0023673896|nr:DUF5666 domain-containing protein [Paenarthrobacter sp. AB444]MDD7836566.1 DUF5666 domain-containing protein [Paenarthrobacter sp. AB444]